MQPSQPRNDRVVPLQREAGSAGFSSGAKAAELRISGYVLWQLPVRITHWVTVICIGILTVTGIYIENPFLVTNGLASNQYLMGSMRFIHFVTAFVFTTSVLFRIYWAFVGNRYSRWNQFLPVSKARLRDARHMLAYYLFLRRHPPTTVGHNALAGATYVVVYLLLVLQIVTGFALYALPFDAGTFWPIAFGWMTTAFGTQPVRLVHTILMWLFLAFTIHHVYSAILIDIEKRAGLMSSIFTGFQSLTPAQLADAQAEESPPPKNRRPFWSRFSRKAGQDHA
jgi:Ni/Fe-hydrogenase 1 B-type cytochrome subunit